MKRIFILIFSISIFLTSFELFAVNVDGKVLWQIDPGFVPAKIGHWFEIDPTISKAGIREIDGVLVLESGDKNFSEPSNEVPVIIENLAFLPSVIVAKKGASLKIENKSNYKLTVHLVGKDYNKWIKIEEKDGKGTLKLPENGMFYLQADEFSHLKTPVLVGKNAKVFKPNKENRFKINDLKSGTYKISFFGNTWIDGQKLKIEGEDDINLELTVNFGRKQFLGAQMTKKELIVPQFVNTIPPQFPVPVPPNTTNRVKPRPYVAPAPAPKVQKSTPVTKQPTPESQVTAPALPKKAPTKTKQNTPAKPKKKDTKKKKGGFFKIRVID